MLWLALYLPQFSLEITATDRHSEIPAVIYETDGARQTVHSANQAARSAGITAGMPLTAARALSHNLKALVRNSTQEKDSLENLALWAQQFTSKVSLQPPNGLLLEIGASLKLFAGLKNLTQTVLSRLTTLNYSSSHGIATTPTAAWLLALEGKSRVVVQLNEINGAILPLPLELLPLAREKNEALRNLGLQSIGDCLRLPRDGLTRRLGPELLLYLDRALGLRPEPREYHTPPTRFQAQLLLPEPVLQIEPLLFVLQRLLRQLCGFLLARNMGVQQIDLAFISPSAPSEKTSLTLLHPSRTAEHLFKLWQERLERHKLQAPVEGIVLSADKFSTLNAVALSFIDKKKDIDNGFVQVLERLKNRLDTNALQQISWKADHRPAHASLQSAYSAQYRASATQPSAHRPVWLLLHPQPLLDMAGTPYLHGKLTLILGPERIESGWWDNRGERRDYYIANSSQQQKLWIFRELQEPFRWFLHGFFS